MGGNIVKGFSGSNSDGYTAPTLGGRTKILLQHFHSKGFVYPTGADGVVVTGAAGAWALGAFAEIVPASTITSAFDIHSIYIENANANDVYELVIYAGTTEITRIRNVRISNVGAVPTVPIQTAVMPPNTQVQAKVMSAGGGGDALTISIGYHQYD